MLRSSFTTTTASTSFSTRCRPSPSARQPNIAMTTRAGEFRPFPRSRASPTLSWAIIDHLIEREFDIVTCQEMLVDHAFTLPFKLFWPDGDGPARGSGLHQHGAVPAAERQALRRPRQGGRRSGRGLEERREGRHDRLGGSQPPAGGRARRLHQQAVRPQVHGTAWWTTRNGPPGTASSSSSSTLERRASSS